MILKKFKPITPSLRQLKLVKNDKEFSKNSPVKSITQIKKQTGGRNNQGRITAWHRGGGHKQLYRKIDFDRQFTQGIVEKIEYDPNRTGFIGRIFDFKNNSHSYILAPKNLEIGDYIQSGKNVSLKNGNALPLSQIPIGFLIYNISNGIQKQGTFARSAGTYGQLIQKNATHGRVQLPSGEHRLVPLESMVSIGVVSNINHHLENLGKAGRSRWQNKRPIVRGVAMNPVDHPHGGGEGKTSGGRPSVTPWGKPTKGQPTSKFKKQRSYIVIPAKNRKTLKK
jgi:large subunit ribosomal protein L2